MKRIGYFLFSLFIILLLSSKVNFVFAIDSNYNRYICFTGSIISFNKSYVSNWNSSLYRLLLENENIESRISILDASLTSSYFSDNYSLELAYSYSAKQYKLVEININDDNYAKFSPIDVNKDYNGTVSVIYEILPNGFKYYLRWDMNEYEIQNNWLNVYPHPSSCSVAIRYMYDPDKNGISDDETKDIYVILKTGNITYNEPIQPISSDYHINISYDGEPWTANKTNDGVWNTYGYSCTLSSEFINNNLRSLDNILTSSYFSDNYSPEVIANEFKQYTVDTIDSENTVYGKFIPAEKKIGTLNILYNVENTNIVIKWNIRAEQASEAWINASPRPSSCSVAVRFMFDPDMDGESNDESKDIYFVINTGTLTYNEPINIISFADQEVKRICVANWDTNHDGELSEDEAASVKTLSQVFKNNNNIKSFDELKYFTCLETIADFAFAYCKNLKSVQLPEGIT